MTAAATTATTAATATGTHHSPATRVSTVTTTTTATAATRRHHHWDAPLPRSLRIPPQTTPTYGVPSDMPQRLASARVPTTLTWGQLDWIHSAQVERWRGGRSKDEVPTRIYPLHGHASLCASIDRLRLWEREEMWGGAVAGGLEAGSLASRL